MQTTAFRRRSPEFAAYYGRLSQNSIAPLWEVLKNLVTTEPVTPVRSGALAL